MRQYREAKQLTLEMAAERFKHFGLEDMSPASLSRIERGLQPYSQPILEVACKAYDTDEYSLLWRKPGDPEAIWSIWDQAKPGERRIILETGQSLIKNRAS
jgi:transcriptional regulator with XRE-family HTH domain